MFQSRMVRPAGVSHHRQQWAAGAVRRGPGRLRRAAALGPFALTGERSMHGSEKNEPGPAGRWLSRLLRNKMLMLMLGGALGTYARYVLSKWFNSRPWGQVFPYGTLFINVSGSFLLGAAA